MRAKRVVGNYCTEVSLVKEFGEFLPTEPTYTSCKVAPTWIFSWFTWDVIRDKPLTLFTQSTPCFLTLPVLVDTWNAE